MRYAFTDLVRYDYCYKRSKEPLKACKVRNRWGDKDGDQSAVYANLDEATTAAHVIVAAIEDQDYLQTCARRKKKADYAKPVPTIQTLIELWEAARIANKKKKRSKDPQHKRKEVERTFKQLIHVTDLDKLTVAHLRAVVANWPDKETGKRRVKLVQKFLRWVAITYPVDPLLFEYKVKVLKVKTKVVFKEAQVEEILEYLRNDEFPDAYNSVTAKGRFSRLAILRFKLTALQRRKACLYPILFFLLRYGVRPLESTLLTVGHWNSDLRLLTISSDISKTGEERVLMIDRETAQLIDDCTRNRPAEGRIFLTVSFKPWSPGNLSTCFKETMQELGMKGWLYCTRHTTATRLCKRHRGDLATVKSILGHTEKSSVIMDYLHDLDIEENRKRVAAGYETLHDDGSEREIRLLPEAASTSDTRRDMDSDPRGSATGSHENDADGEFLRFAN